jgi:hypothetical protein
VRAGIGNEQFGCEGRFSGVVEPKRLVDHPWLVPVAVNRNEVAVSGFVSFPEQIFVVGNHVLRLRDSTNQKAGSKLKFTNKAALALFNEWECEVGPPVFFILIKETATRANRVL